MKPIAVFTLTIRTSREHRGRKKLYVTVWKHLKDLRAAAKRSSTASAYYWRQAAGAYVGKQVYNKAGKMRQFGEIHLLEKMIGAGYVAHEMQHFMIHYTEATEVWPLDPEANERIAWIAGDLTAQFWTKFYEKTVGTLEKLK